MIKLTRTGVIIITFSIIILCLTHLAINKYTQIKEIDINNIIENRKEIISEQSNAKETKWQIEIEKISLTATIEEGTTSEILNRNIGHFTETQKEQGNIALAGHNRGYAVNYFKDIKLLKEGDEIKYTYGKYQNTYEVVKNKIIKDTEIEVLENTEENMITLITCVENEPNYRRCVQAIEKEKEEKD